VSEAHPSSFRDPSGFLFRQDGVLFRQVNAPYQEAYDQLMASGLYAKLVEAGLLVAHEEAAVERAAEPGAYRVLRPEPVPFVSYPYEWCFSQLKDAALATLRIQRTALKHGMTLKDGSAYNIQFVGSRPVLIDTLSFDPYREGEPWVAYRQFCQHFLAPLALMARVDMRLGQLLRVHIDGIPLDFASRLLPWRTRLNPGLALHIHAHAASQRRFADETPDAAASRRQMGRASFEGLLDSLRAAVRSLRWQPKGTPWAEYAGMTHYSPEAADAKKALVGAFLDEARPATVWDLGANVGSYSRVASDRGILTIAFDNDPAAVERSYLEGRRRKEALFLPLWMDLTNPTPGIGWDLRERASIQERGPADLVMALALIHHMVVSNNVPFDSFARFLSALGRWLIIEFVPKEDPQVRKLLAWRKDIFAEYDEQIFEEAFRQVYTIRKASTLPGSGRRLYLMEKTPTAA
jgi:ribosomal protein L11 methylase PrmA